MNLVIEQGNSATKIAVFDHYKLLTSSVYSNLEETDLMSLFKKFPLDKGILSTVTDFDDQLNSFLKSQLHIFYRLGEKMHLPIKVIYDTPQTLGHDRVAAVVAGNFLKPENNILIIDAGTAITYDVVEPPGTFIGGNISPGMTTRFRSLNHFTKNLPIVTEKEDVPYIGTSTETAIMGGVVNGIVYEMDGYITDLRCKYPDLFVFLTGGHSFYFERRLKNSIFAAINLVLIGLNRILEYNVESQ